MSDENRTADTRQARLEFARECLAKGLTWRQAKEEFKKKFGVGISTSFYTRARKDFGFGDGRNGGAVKRRLKKGKQKNKRKESPDAKYKELVPAQVIEDCQRPKAFHIYIGELRRIMREHNIRSIEITQEEAKVTTVEVVKF